MRFQVGSWGGAGRFFSKVILNGADIFYILILGWSYSNQRAVLYRESRPFPFFLKIFETMPI
jgi:hypothetical protein